MKNGFFFSEFTPINQTSDHLFSIKDSYIFSIKQSIDRKVQLVEFVNGKVLLGVVTRNTYVSYYPIHPIELEYPIKAVLMDLDGTTLYSENFWMFVIQETIRTISCNESFSFSDTDIPFVSGHSVYEHLSYCIEKYCPYVLLKNAVDIYYITAHSLLNKVINGTSNCIELEPAHYLKEFIQYLLDHDIKIGLVTSGIYEKAYPEIWSVCSKLKMGKPEEVYDSIITAGNPLREHKVGNLGELSAKPHPWLYLEEAIVGLNVELNDRRHVLGIEDSGAGICSLLSAGIPAIGLSHGNIIKSGYSDFCIDICESLEEVMKKYFLQNK